MSPCVCCGKQLQSASGSVHGCVSCPVVVKPWDPESLAGPQHPLPSLSHSQTQTYSLPQRSSSVHPLSAQHGPSDDKPCNDGLLSDRHSSVRTSRKRHLNPKKDEEKENSAHNRSSPEKTGSLDSFSQKNESFNGSPQKLDSVFRSQIAFAEQYERLLGPKNSGMQDVTISSQTTDGQSNTFGELRKSKCKRDAQNVESHITEHEINTSPPEPVAIADPSDTGGKTDHAKKLSSKDISTGSSLLPVTNTFYLPGSSRLGSPPQLHRINFSPPPLPSIQNRSKVHVKDEPSQDLPQIPHIKSLRSNKGLPSISNPRFQAGKDHLTSPPPIPVLSTKQGKKLQVLGRKCNEQSRIRGIPRDRVLKHVEKRKSNVQDQKLGTESGGLSEEVPSKTPFSRHTKSVLPVYHVNNQDDGLFQHAHMTGFSVSSSTPHSWDAPTPQSLDSSSWSFGKSAVAPEVDALTTASAAGDLHKVKSLLSEGVDVNAVNTFGRTAVQVMSVDNTDLAEVLLMSGANPNVQDEGRSAASSTFRTIAHDVAASGNTDMLRCLLRYGVDVNLKDRWGNTPLHLAARAGHLNAVRLLRRGTSIYQANLQGKTPVMLLEELNIPAVKQWVDLKKSTVSHLQTLCVLAIRQQLGPHGLRCWRKHAPSFYLQRQVLLQCQGGRPPMQASASTLLSSRLSAGSRSLRACGNGTTQTLAPGMSINRQMTDFLTMRDLIPCRLSTGENTSLEVHNTSSGQSNDDVSLSAHPCSSLASETGSLFETNLSSIDASQSADDISLPSFDQSL